MTKLNPNAKNAIKLGALCSVAYLAVYIARNILSAVTPLMAAEGYDTEYIGSVSSLFLVFYAVGQLINGMIGDRIKAKYMISLGLLLAGVTNLMFPLLIDYRLGALIVYGMTGFFLSMIYGPMTKMVSENTEPIYTTRCSLGYTFASFLGSPAAGILAVFMSWSGVFVTSSAVLFIMGVSVLLLFGLFEKRGIIKYNAYVPEEKNSGDVRILFKYQIVRFSLVSILTGIIRTSVVFWLPMYFSDYLGYGETKAAGIFSIATFILSMTSFITVFVYERFLNHDLNKTVLVMFTVSAVFFLLTYFVYLPFINIVLIMLAIMGNAGAATMLWSRYCPSLRDTGLVSSATGFLDFLSYSAAAAANLFFAGAIDSIGWKNLILVWCALVTLGVFVVLPYGKVSALFKKKTKEENTTAFEEIKSEKEEDLETKATENVE